MALFGSARDASLIRSVNRELINEFIDTEVALYKLSLGDSATNIYDESDSKVYYSPMRINSLIQKGTDLGFTLGDRDEFGLSVAIRAEGHLTRRNGLNIREVRFGINKTNTKPKNL